MRIIGLVLLVLLISSNIAFAETEENLLKFNNQLLSWKVNQMTSNKFFANTKIKLKFDQDYNVGFYVDTLQPLAQSKNDITFMQIIASNSDTLAIGQSYGLGYRHMFNNQIIGINQFKDDYFSGKTRDSVGFEYFYKNSKVVLNKYEDGEHGNTGYDYSLRFVNSSEVYMFSFSGYHIDKENVNQHRIGNKFQVTPHLYIDVGYEIYKSPTYFKKDPYVQFKYDFINKTYPSIINNDKTRAKEHKLENKMTKKIIRSEYIK